MEKVHFLKLIESFMSENYISQLHGYGHKKTRKERYFIQGVMIRKNSGKEVKGE